MIQNIFKAGKDPVQESVKFLTHIYLFSDDPRTPIIEKDTCTGLAGTRDVLTQQTTQWGFSQQQTDTCLQVSLEPVTEKGWVDPFYWHLEPNMRVYLGFDPDTKTCSWIREPLSDAKRDEYIALYGKPK
jgi:hypothetical protein